MSNFYWKLLGFAVTVSIGLTIGFSMMEANTFNKFTNGPKASWMDAIFIELRVQV